MPLYNNTAIKDNFPLIRNELRRIAEKPPVETTIGGKHRKISFGLGALAIARLGLQPFGLAFRAAGRMMILFITVIGAIVSEKARKELGKVAISTADSVFVIPLNAITNFMMIFKHFVGVANPKICYRTARPKELQLMQNWKEARGIGKNYLDVLNSLPVQDKRLVNMKRLDQLANVHIAHPIHPKFENFVDEVVFMNKTYPVLLREHRDMRNFYV